MKVPALAVMVAAALFLLPADARQDVKVFFNSHAPLDDEIMKCFSMAVGRAKEKGEGTIDVAIFSFTSRRLADTLLRIGRDFPDVKIRILANLSMHESEYSAVPYMDGVASGEKERYRELAERRGAYIEDEEKRKTAVEKAYKKMVSQFRGRPIPNIEVRYHYYPGWSWKDEEGGPAYDHFHQKSHIWHHKAVIINRDLLASGSYNWSSSAEIKNLENLMVFTGPEDRHIVNDFLAEFEAMWNNPELCKSGKECRRLRDERYKEILEDRKAKEGREAKKTKRR
ncbi:MAG: phospholipase D-like domain-containing protein [Candidatus Tritonobacter lacicola]|nr:phospholipase D-like domain-containing protein [Candidatus Tritonobacter lacicola]